MLKLHKVMSFVEKNIVNGRESTRIGVKLPFLKTYIEGIIHQQVKVCLC